MEASDASWQDSICPGSNRSSRRIHRREGNVKGIEVSNAFDLDARISTPTAGSAGEQAPPPSISVIATRTICTKIACKVTSTCACTAMCTILCVGGK